VKLVLVAAAALLLLPVVLLAATVGALGGAGIGMPLGTTVGAPVADGLAVAAAQAGFSGQGLRLAVAVGMAESGGNPIARNPNQPTPGCPAGSLDRGAWQLNSCYHPEVGDACADDLACAAEATYRISAGGSDWREWTTYTSGAYRAQLGAAAQAIATLAAPNPGGGIPSGYGAPGPSGLSRATEYTRHLVTELSGITDIGGCALFTGQVAGSDHYPEKPASSGLLKAQRQVRGNEFAEPAWLTRRTCLPGEQVIACPRSVARPRPGTSPLRRAPHRHHGGHCHQAKHYLDPAQDPHSAVIPSQGQHEAAQQHQQDTGGYDAQPHTAASVERRGHWSAPLLWRDDAKYASSPANKTGTHLPRPARGATSRRPPCPARSDPATGNIRVEYRHTTRPKGSRCTTATCARSCRSLTGSTWW